MKDDNYTLSNVLARFNKHNTELHCCFSDSFDSGYLAYFEQIMLFFADGKGEKFEAFIKSHSSLSFFLNSENMSGHLEFDSTEVALLKFIEFYQQQNDLGDLHFQLFYDLAYDEYERFVETLIKLTVVNANNKDASYVLNNIELSELDLSDCTTVSGLLAITNQCCHIPEQYLLDDLLDVRSFREFELNYVSDNLCTAFESKPLGKLVDLSLKELPIYKHKVAQL